MITKQEAKELRAVLDKLGIVVGMGWDTQSMALGWVLGRYGFRPNAVELSNEIDEAMPKRYPRSTRTSRSTNEVR